MIVEEYYLSNLCHELNTTMNAFCYVVDQLEHTELPQHQLKMIQVLKGATHSMKGYIREIASDKVHAFDGSCDNERMLDPFPLLENMCELFRFQAEKKGLELNVHFIKGSSNLIFADEIKLSHVFMNIISNAIKYTHKGSVNIYLEHSEVSPLEDKIIFTCIDTGVGISSNALPNVYERGFRDPSVFENNISGTGVGLSIVKDIVQSIHGNISIESEVGVGSTIQITCCFKHRLENDFHGYIYEMKYDSDFAHKKVLIVDDNQINLLLLRSMLERNGFEVYESNHGLDAIEKVKQEDFDLILLDIHMPDISGIEVLYNISFTLNKTVPVIAITADVSDAEIAHLKIVGFKDVIAKPIEESELLHSLSSVHTIDSNPPLLHLDLITNVENALVEMTSGDVQRLNDLQKHLKQELIFAIDGWNRSLEEKDWNLAKNILHREKVMLTTLGIQEFDFMTHSILTEGNVYTDPEMSMMYSSISDTFNAILGWLNR